MRITEFAYGGKVAGADGGNGEYVELTNLNDAPQDLTGWTYDNHVATAATGLSLTPIGTLAPGESAIITDVSPTEFRDEWGLKDTVKVLSNGNTHTLSAGPDSIHIYNQYGDEVDSVSYANGFESAEGKAAWVDPEHLGLMQGTTGWHIASVLDTEGSWVRPDGSVGSPGAATAGNLTPDDVRLGGEPEITINEVTSDNSNNGFAPLPSGSDLIELYNRSNHTVSLAGWKQTDSNPQGYASAIDFSNSLYVDGLPSTMIPSGQYGVFASMAPLSNLGDSVKIYDFAGNLVDSLDFAAGQAGTNGGLQTTYHALAACGDGSDVFQSVTTASFGVSNADACLTAGEAWCDTSNSGTDPGTLPSSAVTWPGGDRPNTVGVQCGWVTAGSGRSLSGLAFDPTNPNVLYAVKDKSHLYRLLRSGSGWAKDTTNGWTNGKDLRLPGGGGLPDTEGLTVGPDGSVYVTTERDYANPGVFLDSILEFDPSAADTTLLASDQWEMTDLGFEDSDADLGFKGVAYVPDDFLTASGFKTDAGAFYDPADFPNKVTAGLFVVAEQKTGHVLAYVLNSDRSYVRVADIATGMAAASEVSYDADLGRLWVHCDNTCGNTTALLRIGSSGHFTVEKYYSRPAKLPNYDFEGFAVAPISTAVNGMREVLWADDGNRFGYSLWSGTINVNLGLAQSPTPDPIINGSGTFGTQLTATVGSWDPSVATSYQWKRGATVLGSDAPLTLADSNLVGSTVTLSVTGTRAGFADVTKSATIVVNAATLPAPTPSIGGKAVVGATLVANVGAWGPGAVSLKYAWFANGVAVPGAVDSSLKLGAAQVGKTITVAVTGTRAGFANATAKSAPTAPVAKGTITTKVPTISGRPKVGGKLTAKPGTWKAGAAGVTFNYQWRANGRPIRGAMRSTYTVGTAQRGKKISVTVIGSAAGYVTVSETSARIRLGR
jgi:hypothetical protein